MNHSSIMCRMGMVVEVEVCVATSLMALSWSQEREGRRGREVQGEEGREMVVDSLRRLVTRFRPDLKIESEIWSPVT